MYTKRELNILQSALRNWPGPYGTATARITDAERGRMESDLNTAAALAARFEEILQHYHQMESNYQYPVKFSG